MLVPGWCIAFVGSSRSPSVARARAHDAVGENRSGMWSAAALTVLYVNTLLWMDTLSGTASSTSSASKPPPRPVRLLLVMVACSKAATAAAATAEVVAVAAAAGRQACTNTSSSASRATRKHTQTCTFKSHARSHAHSKTNVSAYTQAIQCMLLCSDSHVRASTMILAPMVRASEQTQTCELISSWVPQFFMATITRALILTRVCAHVSSIHVSSHAHNRLNARTQANAGMC